MEQHNYCSVCRTAKVLEWPQIIGIYINVDNKMTVKLPGSEPNDEECDATEDAQRTERWQYKFSVSGRLKIANRKAVCDSHFTFADFTKR